MARNNTFLLAKLGSVPSYVKAAEYGDKHTHTSVLTIDTTLPAIAGGANLGVGKLIYTFPAGSVRVKASYMSVVIQQTQGNITADTPEVGLGTVIASGAVAVLSGTATFENIITGQVAADCDGTATVVNIGTELIVTTAGAHTVYLNVADGWAASGDAAAILQGTVVIHWEWNA